MGTLRNQGLEIELLGTLPFVVPFCGIPLSILPSIRTWWKTADGSQELQHTDYDGNAVVLKSIEGRPYG